MLPVRLGIAFMMAQLATLGVQANRPDHEGPPGREIAQANRAGNLAALFKPKAKPPARGGNLAHLFKPKAKPPARAGNLAHLFKPKTRPPVTPPEDSAGDANLPNSGADFERCCTAWDNVPEWQRNIPGLKDKKMTEKNCPDFDTETDPEKCVAVKSAAVGDFERCCGAWDTVPGWQRNAPGLKDKKMHVDHNCPDFDTEVDPEKCEAAKSAALEEDAPDGDSGGVPEWESEVTPEDWKEAKADLSKQLKDLKKLEASLEKERAIMTSMGSAIFGDIIKNVQREGFMAEDEDVDSLADQWSRLLVPTEFGKLFKTVDGKAKVPTRVLGEILPQPALFKTRINALQKFFAVMHIEGSSFLMSSEDGFLKWPTRMLSGQSSFGSVLDSLADTWKEKCSLCPIDKSCLSPSASLGCHGREAIAFDPSGPLEKRSWEVLSFQWRCIDTPELLSAFAAKRCTTQAPSGATFDQKKGMLKKLIEDNTFKEIPKSAFNISMEGWFRRESAATQFNIVTQIIGRGDLDTAEVAGPMKSQDVAEGKLKLASLKKEHGLRYEAQMIQWLKTEGFGGIYADKIRDAIRQLQGMRSRRFVQWPICPVGSEDCLGDTVRQYLFDEVSQEETAAKMMETASISWGTTDVAAATALLSPVQKVSQTDERKELKEASDKLLKQVNKVKYVGSKIARDVYSP
jgi:hypothetical protein